MEFVFLIRYSIQYKPAYMLFWIIFNGIRLVFAWISLLVKLPSQLETGVAISFLVPILFIGKCHNKTRVLAKYMRNSMSDIMPFSSIEIIFTYGYLAVFSYYQTLNTKGIERLIHYNHI